MATGGDRNLTDGEIEKLAEAIEVTKMETIAISYLKIQSEMVANWRVAHQGNPTAFNRSLLNLWKYMNPGGNQAQVSVRLVIDSAGPWYLVNVTWQFYDK